MSSWKLLLLLLALVSSVVPDTVVNISGYITCRLPGPFKYRQLIVEDPDFGQVQYLYIGSKIRAKRSPHFYNVTIPATTDILLNDIEDTIMVIQHNCNSGRQEEAARYELGEFYERNP